MKYPSHYFSAIALPIAFMATSAYAQVASTNASKNDAPTDASGLSKADSSEIVVTARRRSENIEKVPIAITAFGAKQMQERSIFSESDLQTAVPGLTIVSNGNANTFNYSIRGQSVDNYTDSPPAILTYTDEAPIVNHSASSYYDLEGIQVLKGPQGTLFGRNTTGGAVLYQTAKPDEQFGGYVDVRYGNYNSSHVDGAISVPISDQVAFRIAGSFNNGGGYVRDLTTNTYLGDQDNHSIRGTLVLKPIEGLVNTTVVQDTREGGTNIPTYMYSAYACGSTYNGAPLADTAACLYSPSNPAFAAWAAAHPNIYQGGLVAYTAYQRQLGLWTSELNYPDTHYGRSTYVINTTSYQISPTLTVKNIFSHNNVLTNDLIDYDGTPYPIFQTGGTPTADATSATNTSGYIQGTKQTSDELQLQGKAFNGRMTFVLGAFYSSQYDENDSNVYVYDFSPIASGIAVRYHAGSWDKSEAVFGQATYSIRDDLHLTGGVRYTWDQQSAQQLPGSVFGLSFPKEHMTSSDPSWMVSLDYQAKPSLLLYVTQRGSWRTGGFNFSVLPVNTSGAYGGNAFYPETSEDVEAGIKYSGRELGVPITINMDVFNQWVSNVQRAAYILGTSGTTESVTVNVPAAQTRGFEFDASIRPTPDLQFGASATVSDPHYTQGRVVLDGTVNNFGPYADAPKFTGTFYAQASHTLAKDAGTLTLRADLFAQSSMWFSNVGATVAPDTKIAGYALVNTRLTWANMMGSKVTAAFFVHNLFNRSYFAGGNAAGPTAGINDAVVGQPRMFGGELRVNL